MKLIVAVNSLGFIGKDGKLLCKSKEDMKHFKTLTTGEGFNVVIVGSKTYENDLRGKALPNRLTIPVGSKYDSLSGAVERAYDYKNYNLKEFHNPKASIWVIGGASIYKHLIYLCDEIHMSIFEDNKVEGDVRFDIPADYRGEVFKYYFKED